MQCVKGEIGLDNLCCRAALHPWASSEKQGAWANEARLLGQPSLPLLALHILPSFEDQLNQQLVIGSQHCFLCYL